MIKNFKDKETESLFRFQPNRFPPTIQTSARKRLVFLNAANAIEELRWPPGNHFEALTGRPGVYSIRINIQWRIIFRWDNGAVDVKIEDYH